MNYMTLHFVLWIFLSTALAQIQMSPMLSKNWSELISYPLEVSEVQGAILPDGEYLPAELVVFGGSVARTGWRPTVEAYALNIKERRGTWRRVKDLPDEITHQAHTVVKDVLYLCGGYLGRFGRSIAKCYGYNHTSDDWISLPPLPGRRGGGGLVYIERLNALFYSGGALRAVTGIRNEMDKPHSWMLELENLAAGWVRKANMPNPRNHLAAVSVKNRVFFTGGQRKHDEKHGNQRSNHEYISEEDVWIERAPLPIEMGHATSSTISYLDGFVVVGGSTRGLRLLDHVLYYHLSSNSWHFVTDYPRGSKSMVCDIKINQLVCAGGQAPKGQRWNDVWTTDLTELKEVSGFMTRS